MLHAKAAISPIMWNVWKLIRIYGIELTVTARPGLSIAE
jgi:hypothetical protein